MSATPQDETYLGRRDLRAMSALPKQAAPSGESETRMAVTHTQEDILRGLLHAGGRVPYAQLARAVYGLRREDLPSVERSRVGVSVRGLERKGMVRVSRKWGSWEWGQPVSVELTDQGRAIAERL